MTQEELLLKLKKLAARSKMRMSDKETIHIDADNALLEFIADAQISAAFGAIRKWYA